MSASVEERVRNIICDQLAVEPEKVTLTASFIDDLGADSLDIVELVMTMEEEFDLDIPDEDAEKMKTVGDVVKYIASKVQLTNDRSPKRNDCIAINGKRRVVVTGMGAVTPLGLSARETWANALEGRSA